MIGYLPMSSSLVLAERRGEALLERGIVTTLTRRSGASNGASESGRKQARCGMGREETDLCMSRGEGGN